MIRQRGGRQRGGRLQGGRHPGRRRRCLLAAALLGCLVPLGSCGLLIDEFIQLDRPGPMLDEAESPSATADRP